VGGHEDLVSLWSFEGSSGDAESWVADMDFDAEVLLVDEDRSLIDLYYVDEYDPELDAFAMFPRSFVIDRDGRVAYASAQVDTEGLIAALEAALSDQGR